MSVPQHITLPSDSRAHEWELPEEMLRPSTQSKSRATSRTLSNPRRGIAVFLCPSATGAEGTRREIGARGIVFFVSVSFLLLLFRI